MISFLIYLNATASVVVFFYACKKLNEKQWHLNDGQLWIHSFLIGGSVGVLMHSLLSHRPHHLTEIMFNAAVAAYFVQKFWQKRRLPPPISINHFRKSSK